MERVCGFVREVVMAVRCGSWRFAKELDAGHGRLTVNSAWLGRRREEDESK